MVGNLLKKRWLLEVNIIQIYTDGQGETSIPPFQLCWSGGYKKLTNKVATLKQNCQLYSMEIFYIQCNAIITWLIFFHIPYMKARYLVNLQSDSYYKFVYCEVWWVKLTVITALHNIEIVSIRQTQEQYIVYIMYMFLLNVSRHVTSHCHRYIGSWNLEGISI